MTYTANGTEAKLLLWGQGPKWEHSSAPLADSQGSLMAPAQAGRAGHAVRLSGQQVLPEFWPQVVELAARGSCMKL